MINTTQYFQQLEHESTASRCLALIERHAARFMKIGGGALSCPDEHVNRKPMVRTPREKVERIYALIREGKLSTMDIARAVGVSHSVVYRRLPQK